MTESVLLTRNSVFTRLWYTNVWALDISLLKLFIDEENLVLRFDSETVTLRARLLTCTKEWMDTCALTKCALIITVRNSSCGKVMFSQAYVILSTGWGADTPPFPPRQPLHRTVRILMECILVKSSRHSGYLIENFKLFIMPIPTTQSFTTIPTKVIHLSEDYAKQTTLQSATSIGIRQRTWQWCFPFSILDRLLQV